MSRYGPRRATRRRISRDRGLANDVSPPCRLTCAVPTRSTYSRVDALGNHPAHRVPSHEVIGYECAEVSHSSLVQRDAKSSASATTSTPCFPQRQLGIYGLFSSPRTFLRPKHRYVSGRLQRRYRSVFPCRLRGVPIKNAADPRIPDGTLGEAPAMPSLAPVTLQNQSALHTSDPGNNRPDSSPDTAGDSTVRGGHLKGALCTPRACVTGDSAVLISAADRGPVER